MKKRIIYKGLAVAVIILFLGLAIQPSVAAIPETEINIEPKDYLFQTIIDIANNPDVKNLIEKHRNDLLKIDVDRSVFRKIFFRNPRLFRSLIFTKPSITYDYLDKCYNKGIEITNIIGEDKALEIIESIEVTGTRVYDEINNIISKDEVLSDRLVILKEMNKELNPDTAWKDYPIICYILFIPTFAVGLIWGSLITIYVILNYYLPIISEIFFYITLPFGVLIFIFAALMFAFGCVSY